MEFVKRDESISVVDGINNGLVTDIKTIKDVSIRSS